MLQSKFVDRFALGCIGRWLMRCRLLGMAMFATVLCKPAFAAEPPVDFNREIRPLLAKKCFACHGPDDTHREAGLRLDQRDGAIEKLESGATAIVPGKSASSELARRISASDEGERM